MPVTPKQAVSLRIFALHCAVEAHKRISADRDIDRRAILSTAEMFESHLTAPLRDEPQVDAAPPVVGMPLDEAEALVTNVSRPKLRVVGTFDGDPAVAHDLIIALQLLKAGRHAPTIGNLPDAAENAHDWAHERDRVVGTLTEAFNLDLTGTDGVGREL